MKPKPKYTQPIGFKPGIYFDMPNEVYHADCAFSHSGMVDILESPLDYWEKSPLNKDRPKFRVTDAMRMGIWSEALLLEPDKFNLRYKVSGTDFKSKKEIIPKFQWDEVALSVRRIRDVPEANDYFTGGMPQVSIFWIDKATGIRLRIRVDYLHFFGGIDYKRIREIRGSSLGWIIADYGYDIQDRLYRTGIAEAKRGLRDGTMQSYGKVDKKWLDSFIKDDRSLFTFCFQRSSKPFPFVIQPLDSEITKQSQVMIEDAIGIYKHHIERYGENEWPAGHVMADPFSIFHLPKRFFDRGTHQL